MTLRPQQFTIRQLLLIMTLIGGVLGFGIWFFRAAQNVDSKGLQNAADSMLDAQKRVITKMPGEKPRKPRKKDSPYKQLVQ